MKKTSISMYSQFSGHSYKAPQIELLASKLVNLNTLCKFYGIKGASHSLDAFDSSTKIPKLVERVVNKFLMFSRLPEYYSYLAAEIALGMLYSHEVKNDNSQVVYCLQRPYSLLRAAKESGKKVLMEYGEMHPIYMRDLLMRDYCKFGINSRSIYTNRFAIQQSIKSIDAADKIVLLSKASAETFFLQNVPKNKVSVLNLGSSISHPAHEVEFSVKKVAFISTAYHSFVKGTQHLLLSWKKSNISTVPLIIVGDLHEDLKEFIAKYGPFKNVVYAGRQNIKYLYKKYNAVGLLCSLAEGYGRSVAEYMSYGFPVIVSPAATCDVVIDKKNGFIVPYDEHDMLSERLIEFTKQPDLIYDMGRSAKSDINTSTMEQYVDGLINIIDNM